MIVTKICSRCKETKNVSEFYKRRKKELRPFCKKCCSLVSKDYYENHREKMISYAKGWQKENPDHCKLRQKTYRNDPLNKRRSYKRRRLPTTRYKRYVASAEERGRSFNLTEEQCYILFNSSCYYCGGPGYGIDRVDNSVGYETYNVVACCTTCNRMKMGSSREEFIKKCTEIANQALTYKEK